MLKFDIKRFNKGFQILNYKYRLYGQTKIY